MIIQEWFWIRRYEFMDLDGAALLFCYSPTYVCMSVILDFFSFSFSCLVSSSYFSSSLYTLPRLVIRLEAASWIEHLQRQTRRQIVMYAAQRGSY